jgi:hypothetical protein
MNPAKFIDPASAAEILEVTPNRIRALLAKDRIPGAQFVFGRWLIPENFKVTPSTKGPKMRAAREPNE